MNIKAKNVDNKNIFIVKYRIHAVESLDVYEHNVIVFNITFLAIYKGVKHRLEQFCYMITKSDELLIPIDNVLQKRELDLTMSAANA